MEVVHSRYLMPVPVHRMFASAWLYKHPFITCQKRPSTSLTHEACESKERSAVRSSMQPCSGHWMAIGRAVVNYARAAHAFKAGIKCWHCRLYILRNSTLQQNTRRRCLWQKLQTYHIQYYCARKFFLHQMF